MTYYPPPPWGQFGREATAGTWPHVSTWGWPEWQHWLRGGGWSEEAIQVYKHERKRYGLGTQPLKRGKVDPNAKVTWLYRPTPKQVEFHKSTARFVLFGGAVGGGKSQALRLDAYKRCLYQPGYQALLLRRTLVELKDTHVIRAQAEVAPFSGRVVGDEEVRFPNGSRIRMGYCDRKGDEQRFLSSEWDCIYFDELATFDPEPVFEIMSRARSAKPGVTAMVRAGSNPGGAHTLWCVDYFVTKTVTKEENPYYKPEEWQFIPSRLYDNPWLMDPDGTFRRYEQMLGNVPEARRRQLLEGDWTAISGQYFPEWTPDKHVRRVEVPRGVKVVRGMDWGFSNPGVCFWVALLPDGHLHVFEEWKFQRTTVAEVAQRIVRRTAELGLGKVSYTVVDPAMFAQQTGESPADTLRRFGVPAVAGDHERVSGWQRLRHWLGDAPDGVPWLTVDPSCRYLIRTLPTAVNDEHNPEDLDTTGDDHALDALRYVVMSRPSPTPERVARRRLEPGTVGWWKDWAQKEARRYARV